MRALVVGRAGDGSADSVADAIALRYGRGAVLRADLAMLGRARWNHAIDADGRTSTAIDFGEGRQPDFDVVFHRIGDLSDLQFPTWTEEDRAYGRTEWLALLLSWLRGLGTRVINAPDFGKLNGPDDNPWIWIQLAIAVGFPVHPMGATTSTRVFPMPSQGCEHRALHPNQVSDEFFNVKATGYIAPAHSSGSVLVIGGQVVGDLDLDTTAHGHCVRLASLSKLDVLSVSLARDRLDSEWRFAGACAAPSLHDPRAVAATVALMERRAA